MNRSTALEQGYAPDGPPTFIIRDQVSREELQGCTCAIVDGWSDGPCAYVWDERKPGRDLIDISPDEEMCLVAWWTEHTAWEAAEHVGSLAELERKRNG